MNTVGKSNSLYKPVWIAVVALLACIAVGYAIGTKVAVNTLFGIWAWGVGAPATIHMIRFKDTKSPGAVPALIMWIAWFVTTIMLGTMVFGEKCPLVRIPQLGTPGVE